MTDAEVSGAASLQTGIPSKLYFLREQQAEIRRERRVLRMKKFLRKRWHRIPVGVISALLVLGLVTGGVFAAYTVWMGNANVTVVECITVTNTGGDGGEVFTTSDVSWDVSIYPGQSKSLNVLVSNISPNPITVISTGTGNEGVNAVWSGVHTVPGNGSTVLTLTVDADADAYPGARTIFIKIAR